MSLQIFVLSVYILIIIGLGFFIRQKTKTVSDFVLGSRTVGPWMSAFSFGTAYFSAVLLIGFAGKVGWSFGMSALAVALGNAFLGTFLAWKILGKKTREMTAHLGTLTLPSFLEKRYKSTRMKGLASIIIFVFFIPYTASVFMGLSYLFESIFNIPYESALYLMGGLSAIYLVLGGYLAMAIIDFFQGLIMIVGILIMVHFVNLHPLVNGFGQALYRLKAVDPALILPHNPNAWIAIISLVILTSLGTWGLPQMLMKFYGIKSASLVPKATLVSTGFALIISMGAYYTGALGRLFFQELPSAGSVQSPDLIMPNIISQALPELAALLILILVMSASMSTLTSLVLVSGSTLSLDIIGDLFCRKIKPATLMMIMRIACVIFIFLAIIIALNPPDIMLTLMSLSWGSVAGAFLAPYLYGLFNKKTTRMGAWAGMLSGVTISVGGYLILSLKPGFISPGLMERLSVWGAPFFGSLAILLPLVIVPLVSHFTPQFAAQEIERMYPVSKVKTPATH